MSGHLSALHGVEGTWDAGRIAVPIELKEPHLDCYVCMTKSSGFLKKNKSRIIHPDCVSALKPVPHDAKNPITPCGFAESGISDRNQVDDDNADECFEPEFD